MALNSLFCADVPLSNYSLTHVLRTVSLIVTNSLHSVVTHSEHNLHKLYDILSDCSSGITKFLIFSGTLVPVQRCPACLAWRVAVGIGHDLGPGSGSVDRTSRCRTVDGKSWGTRTLYYFDSDLTETIIIHHTNIQ